MQQRSKSKRVRQTLRSGTTGRGGRETNSEDVCYNFFCHSGVVQLVAREPLELVILVRVQAPEPTLAVTRGKSPKKCALSSVGMSDLSKLRADAEIPFVCLAAFQALGAFLRRSGWKRD